MPRPRLPKVSRFPAARQLARSFGDPEKVREDAKGVLRGGHIERQRTGLEPQREHEERTASLLQSGELAQPTGQDRICGEGQTYTAVEAFPRSRVGEQLRPGVQATALVRSSEERRVGKERRPGWW